MYDSYGLSKEYQAFNGQSPAAIRDPVGFGGQWGYYTDFETAPAGTTNGLLCLTHRYYDPATGRFINRDPIGYSGGMNLYSFSGGNPVNKIDPNGTDDFALISLVPVQKQVSPPPSWQQRWRDYLTSPGFMIGIMQGEIDTQRQFDQTAAMRRMSEESRDENTGQIAYFDRGETQPWQLSLRLRL